MRTAIEEDFDSRNATFDRRIIPHEAAEGYSESGRSFEGRSKRRPQQDRSALKQEDIRESVPAEFNFHTAEMASEHDSGSLTCELKQIESAIKDAPPLGSLGAAPTINWNLGTKARIRTTLGGSRLATLSVPTTPIGSTPSSTNVQTDQGAPEMTKPSTDGTSPEEVNGPTTINWIEHPQEQPQSSEDDNGVILNLYTDGPESGEVSESAGRESDLCRDSIGHGERQGQENDEETNFNNDSHLTEEDQGTDAMMNYSDSNHTYVAPDTSQPVNAVVEKSQPQILDDLDSEELQLQLRYFYTTVDPLMVNRSNPVRCLVCTKIGHTSDECDTLTCLTCQAYNDHFTQDCSTTRRCPKCHERGHDRLTCPYKLPRISTEEMKCSLCQRQGHFENDCELIWRTSERPWESRLSKTNIHLSCYECGSVGHLGNDCPTRNPRKPKGSSSWTLWGRGSNSATRSLTTYGKDGIAIKGMAHQRDIVRYDSSDDEGANFHRPRIPPPARNGQIRIASGNFQRNQESFVPSRNAPLRKDDYDDRRSDQYRHAAKGYGQYHGGNYRGRSRSPHLPVQGGFGNPQFRGDRYGGYRGDYDGTYDEDYDSQNPPLPPGPPPFAKAEKKKIHQRGRATGFEDSYRPMPSAAQNAWKKHLV